MNYITKFFTSFPPFQDYEKFVQDAAIILTKFEKASEETLYRQQDERLSTEELLRRQHRLKEVVIDQPSNVLQIGEL